MVSEGIFSAVLSQQADAIVTQSSSFAQALTLCEQQGFEFVFLDLRLPDVHGFQAIEAFRARLLGTAIAIVSGEEDPATVMNCLQLGARAFIPKSLTVSLFKAAIGQVLRGGTYAPARAIAQLSAVVQLPSAQAAAAPWGLTARQMDVATLLVDGMPNKLIADRLAIAESTVKLHVSSILRQMRVTNRSQAILLLARSGLHLPGSAL